MKRNLLTAAMILGVFSVAVASLPTVAYAAPVTFSTSGPGTTYLTEGPPIVGQGIQVTFAGVGSTPINTPATPVALGTFSWSEFGIDVYNGTDTAPFSLAVNQTSPVGSGSFLGALEGTFRFNLPFGPFNESVTVSFANTSITLAGIKYQLLTGPGGGNLANNADLNISSGGTTLYAQISAVPEPSAVAFAITGLGTLGLAGLRRRRRNAVATA